MAEETIMVLKVDLGCSRCYKKVKKLLCKYSEIRDQVFNEKEGTVIIKVVCCSPERIRSKLICKSDGAIKSIEIRKPEKPKPTPAPEKPKEAGKPKEAPKPQEAEKPKPPPEKPPEKPKEVEKPKRSPEKPKDEKKEADKPKPPPEKSKEGEKPPKPADKPAEKPPAAAPKPAPAPTPAPAPAPAPAPTPPAPAPDPAPAPAPGYPQFFPVAVCCKPCYETGHGGPCQHGYGVPYQPPPSSYDGYVRLLPSYGEPSYGGWPSGCQCNRSYGCRCHCEYFTEENPPCTIM